MKNPPTSLSVERVRTQPITNTNQPAITPSLQALACKPCSLQASSIRASSIRVSEPPVSELRGTGHPTSEHYLLLGAPSGFQTTHLDVKPSPPGPLKSRKNLGNPFAVSAAAQETNKQRAAILALNYDTESGDSHS